MSYDTRLITRCKHCNLSEIHYDANYTYNCGPMFRLALYGDTTAKKGWTSLDGMKAAKAVPLLTKAYLHMVAPDNAEAYKKLNPSNGWGYFESATEYLKNLLDACIEYPKATIEIS